MHVANTVTVASVEQINVHVEEEALCVPVQHVIFAQIVGCYNFFRALRVLPCCSLTPESLPHVAVPSCHSMNTAAKHMCTSTEHHLDHRTFCIWWKCIENDACNAHTQNANTMRILQASRTCSDTDEEAYVKKALKPNLPSQRAGGSADEGRPEPAPSGTAPTKGFVKQMPDMTLLQCCTSANFWLLFLTCSIGRFCAPPPPPGPTAPNTNPSAAFTCIPHLVIRTGHLLRYSKDAQCCMHAVVSSMDIHSHISAVDGKMNLQLQICSISMLCPSMWHPLFSTLSARLTSPLLPPRPLPLPTPAPTLLLQFQTRLLGPSHDCHSCN